MSEKTMEERAREFLTERSRRAMLRVGGHEHDVTVLASLLTSVRNEARAEAYDEAEAACCNVSVFDSTAKEILDAIRALVTK